MAKLKVRLAAINEEDRSDEIEKEETEMGEPKSHSMSKGEEVVGEEEVTEKELLEEASQYKFEHSSVIFLLYIFVYISTSVLLTYRLIRHKKSLSERGFLRYEYGLIQLYH